MNLHRQLSISTLGSPPPIMGPQAGPKGEEELHPKPGCDSFCPGMLFVLVSIQHIHATHMPAGNIAASPGLYHRKESSYGGSGGQTGRPEGLEREVQSSHQTQMVVLRSISGLESMVDPGAAMWSMDSLGML